MSTIFISHSSKDNEIARELERRLAEQNHPSVFLDLDPEKGIVAGQSWERTLYRKLRACRAVVVLCTDNYLTSQWCFAEIALARMEGKHILALQVDPLSPDAKLPSILTEKQFINLRTNSEEGYERLWRGLKEMDLLGVSNEWDPKQSPYLGLDAYQEQHAPVFFGRDDETRVGIELLDRGSPGLVMVLGSSGSGKSSMVRAGMVPRLLRDLDRWLLVGPFRPGRDPFAELSESFVEAYQRYAPDEARSAETRERIRALSRAGSGSSSSVGAGSTSGNAEQAAAPAEGERLRRLLKELEDLRRSPPGTGGSNLLQFLDWSLDDLRRICGEESEAPPAAAAQADASLLVELAAHLRRVSGHREARVLLVIDQFEELLGHEDTTDDGNRFLDLVRESLKTEHSPLMALGTMRSDFLGLFQRNRALLGIDFESLSVGPMSVGGMRRVIEEPAKLGAIELEPGLADSLLKDTETPDALPLLSFTLSVLWRDCHDDGLLEIKEYEQLGGLHGAIAREADAVLASA
ncbi:MAG: toll/interleukin-1 receptor domain-containing protein, partial [Pyrinomonadaceae bacterium]